MKVNRENIAHHLLEYQLSLIGKTFKEAKENKQWLTEWSITPELQTKLFKYAIPLIKKVFKCNTSKATHTFNWFDFGWGLRVEE